MATRSAPAAGLPEAVVEDLLSSTRRRYLLECLHEAGGEMVVCDLATAVAAREAGGGPEAIDRETRERVSEDIYERHLPKLTATAVVEFDSMRGRVSLLAPDLVGAGGR